jgi:polar amino acid transport system permease protein
MDVFLTNFVNVETLVESYPLLLEGLVMTFRLIVVIVPLAIAVGLVIAVLYSFHVRPVNAALIVYVDVLRSFPPLVLLILIFNGLPFLGLTLREFPAVVLALVLNGSSYYGEIFRAGIESIPKGQREAARSTGMTAVQTMTAVVLPQALRNVVPPLTSNTLELIKGTSLASVVALPELLRAARIAQGLAYNPTPLIAAALIYLVLLWPMVRLVSRLERRMLATR